MTQRTSQAELRRRLDAAGDTVIVGDTYKHYKGSLYIVTDLGIDEASESVSVVYQALYDEQLTFIRPLSSWTEMIELDGKKVRRFEEA